MSITSLGGGGANSLLLQQMLASLSANPMDQTDGSESSGSADSTGQSGAISLGPSPPPADSQPSDLFSSDTLGALTATQAAGSGATSASSLLDQVSSDLASGIMGAADTNGDGGLSLSEIETALGSGASSGTGASATGTGSSATSGRSSSLANAFASLDTDGDGELSLSELTTGLEQAIGQSASQPSGQPPFGPPPFGPPSAASADATSTPSAATGTDTPSGAGSDPTTTTTVATASTTDPATTTDPTSNPQVASLLASLLLQYANASYSSQAQEATATTTAAMSITA